MLHMLGLPKFGFDLSRAKSLKLTISREKYERERGVQYSPPMYTHVKRHVECGEGFVTTFRENIGR